MKNRYLFLIILTCFLLGGCIRINLYEKQVSIPSQKWSYNFTPEFNFEIKDTTSRFLMYVIIRHREMYKYNNLWLLVGSKAPGDTMKYQRLNLQLATADNWEGKGMDDIYEVRKLISPGQISFRKPGDYTISLSQIMRENPLPYIMNVGIRIEKVH